MEQTCEDNVGSSSNFTSIDNFPSYLDEPSKPSFDHISIESIAKFVQFTLASWNLMITCLQRGKFPTFHEIREADGNFRPLLTSHGRPIDINDVTQNEERWKKLLKNLKCIETIDGVSLSSFCDKKERQIAPIEKWPSIVSHTHVDGSGKHLSMTATISALRSKWSLDQKVGDISQSYIENCVTSCPHCQETQFWDEVHKVPYELLDDKLDEICKTHIVVRRISRSICTRHYKFTYYHCHRGGKKRSRKMMKEENVPIFTSRRERKSMKCHCEFQVKVMVCERLIART
jgi:hypothetical protein